MKKIGQAVNQMITGYIPSRKRSAAKLIIKTSSDNGVNMIPPARRTSAMISITYPFFLFLSIFSIPDLSKVEPCPFLNLFFTFTFLIKRLR